MMPQAAPRRMTLPPPGRIVLLILLLIGILCICGRLAAQGKPKESGPLTPPSEATEGTAATPPAATAGTGASPGTGAAAGTVPGADGVPGIPASPWDIARAMGMPFTIVFAGASLIAMWSAIERIVLLRRRRVIPRAFVERFLMHLRTGRMEKTEALAVCLQNQSPVADIFMHGVRKWGKSSVEIEQAVIDGGERQISLLKQRLRILNGVATVTPLIGLLGTVIGMIQSFNDIATVDAMGQSQQLARGIAMALLTTATGLLIAIPALIAYMFLAGRIDSLVMEMDRLGAELVHLISADAIRERAVTAAAVPQEGKPRRAPAKPPVPG